MCTSGHDVLLRELQHPVVADWSSQAHASETAKEMHTTLPLQHTNTNGYSTGFEDDIKRFAEKIFKRSAS
jgi:hypothetical protein